MPFRDQQEAIAWLRSAEAVRVRCAQMLDLSERDRLDNFSFDSSALDDCVLYVVEVIRENYPDLEIPYHSRWRHFCVGGVDRWAGLAGGLADSDAAGLARLRIDLAVTSVLLDAGAGAAWRYDEPETGLRLARSEGLAIASFRLFQDGLLSADAARPLRADADALAGLEVSILARAFQVGPDNPLVGLEGRTALLRRLGGALRALPDMFGRRPRVGNLFDYLAAKATDGALPATALFAAVLDGLGPIWPGRISLDGVNLGDVWRHPAIHAADPTDGLVPFHKLSQWLTYSLVEPFEAAGLRVTGLDRLTGLAEYRNGGLFIDLGVLRPKHAAVLSEPQAVDSETIVEWRALTVALLDRLADPVRAALGLDQNDFPLAKILEGGTWAAGRRIARERRADGGPPIRIISDGTVF